MYDQVTTERTQQIYIVHWPKSKLKRACDLFRQFQTEGTLYEAKTMGGFQNRDKGLTHPYLAQFIH